MRRVPPGPKPRRWAAPKRAPASQLPHDCATLTLDIAQTTGWCLSVRGIYVSSGEFDLLKHPMQLTVVCAAALELGRANQRIPVVMVYEKPFVAAGEGRCSQYIGAWRMAWVGAGGVKTRMLGCFPATWRARVLGGAYASARRETVRPIEQRMATRIAGRAVGGDEAAAVCLAKWAAHAGEVLAKLPASQRAKAGAA